MTHQELDRLVSIMSANAIKYNRHFRDILERGFSDAAEESFFEEVAEDLQTILRRGVNCGFSKDMRDTVRELTTLAVKIGASGWRAVDLEHLRQEKSNLMASLKMPKEDYMKFDLRNNMKQYLESTKVGMQLLDAAFPALIDAEQASRDACRALLDEIDAAVEKTVDVVSLAAVEQYNAMMRKLKDWRSKLANADGACDASSVALLREVLNAARAWEALSVAVGKPARISDVIAPPVDDLTRVIESEGVKQNVDIFLSHCEAYAEKVKSMRDNGVKEQIDQRKKRISEIQAERESITDRSISGDLDRDDAEDALQDLQDEEDSLNYEIERLKIELVSREEVRNRREMILRIERPIRTAYSHVKHNRLHVHAVFNGIDFAGMIAMINGAVSEKVLEKGVTDIENVLLKRGVIDKKGEVLKENLKKITEEVDAFNKESLGTVPKTETPTEGEGSLLDQMLAKRKASTSGGTIPTDDTHRTGRRTEETTD